VVVLAGATHADERENFEAESFAVDFDSAGAKNAGFFHLAEAFAGGGGREADAAGKFREAQARVGLKLMQELSSVDIEEGR
jgi:hypothetical protein